VCETLDAFGGAKAYIYALGYKSSASLKKSNPYECPLWGKEYGPDWQEFKGLKMVCL
jgi:hypothetical protein